MRPGMYIGSTGPRGLHHLVYEIVDNRWMRHWPDIATIEVTWEQTSGHGEGQRSWNSDRDDPMAKNLFLNSFLRNSMRREVRRGFVQGIGGLYVGSSVVNALSTFFEFEIAREGGLYYGRFEGGDTSRPR